MEGLSFSILSQLCASFWLPFARQAPLTSFQGNRKKKHGGAEERSIKALTAMVWLMEFFTNATVNQEK
jgi:hypothetical protein